MKYRKNLSIERTRLLHEHPADTVELTEAELGIVASAGTHADLTVKFARAHLGRISWDRT